MLILRPLWLEFLPAVELVKLTAAGTRADVRNCVDCFVYTACWRRPWARLLPLLLILRPKLLKASISSLNPTSFLCPAVIAVVFVIWMETDSGVISGRVVELSEVIISLALGSSKVDNEIVFRSCHEILQVRV